VLAQQGMWVAINDVNPATAEEAARAFCADGFKAIAVPADITIKSQVQAMFERVESELGPLWLLVNNAGVFNGAPTADLSEEAWDNAFAVDAKGVFLCSQAAIQRMIPRREGRIVNT